MFHNVTQLDQHLWRIGQNTQLTQVKRRTRTGHGRPEERLGKKEYGRGTPAGWQGVRASVKLYRGGQRRKYNRRRGQDGHNQHGGGIHLAMNEHGDGAFVAGLVGV